VRANLDKFFHLLNKHNTKEISELFDSEISFTDMNGYSTSKKDEVSSGVSEYFKMFPGYHVQILDIEEMMGSFKVIVQTYGTLNDKNREQIEQAYGSLPAQEELHPAQLWKIGFHKNKLYMWMMESIAGSKNAKHTALSFVWAFNTLKPDNVIALTTNPFTTVGITGISETKDKNDWMKSIEDYYKLFPDYRIFPENIHVRGNLVIILGRSDGTMSEYAKKNLKKKDGTPMTKDDLQGPAIWTALTENGLVKEWSIYPFSQKSLEELKLVEYGYKPGG